MPCNKNFAESLSLETTAPNKSLRCFFFFYYYHLYQKQMGKAIRIFSFHPFLSPIIHLTAPRVLMSIHTTSIQFLLDIPFLPVFLYFYFIYLLHYFIIISSLSTFKPCQSILSHCSGFVRYSYTPSYIFIPNSYSHHTASTLVFSFPQISFIFLFSNLISITQIHIPHLLQFMYYWLHNIFLKLYF